MENVGGKREDNYGEKENSIMMKTMKTITT